MQRTTIITLQVVNLITHLLKQSRIAMQNLMKFCPNIPPASQKIELPNTLLSILFSCCQATHLIHWVEQPEGQTWSYLGHRRVQLEMKWRKRRKRKIKSVISVVIQVNHDPQFFFSGNMLRWNSPGILLPSLWSSFMFLYACMQEFSNNF